MAENSVTRALATLPPKPEVELGSVWSNNKDGLLYIIEGLIFDSTNGIDAWKIIYYKYEDTTYLLPFCCDPAEFKIKFTHRIGEESSHG